MKPSGFKGLISWAGYLLVMAWPMVLFAIFPDPSAPKSLIIDHLKDEYDLNGYLYYLGSSEEIDSVEDAFSLLWGADHPSFDRNTDIDHAKSYWIFARLVPGEGFSHHFQNWKLFLGNPTSATVYLLDTSGQVIQQEKTGKWVPLSQKKLKTGHKVSRVNLSFDLQAPLIILIEFEKADSHLSDLSIHLMKYDFMESHEYLLDSRRDWLFLGFFLTMIVFNLLVFGITHDKAFLYHGLFILGVCIFLLDFFGITVNFWFIREHPKMVQLIDYIGLAMMDIAYFQFFRHYLNLKSIFPRWDSIFLKVIYLKVAFFLFISAFYYWTYNEPLADKIAASFLVLEYLLVIAFMAPLSTLNEKKTNYLIAGTLLLLIGLILNALSFIRGMGLWTAITEMGLTGEIICFTIGLAYRFRELRMEEAEAKRLKDLNDFKSHLYANITHEFRTPLTVIKGVNELAEENVNKGLVKELPKTFETVKRNVDSLIRLVDQMLDLAKIDSKMMQVRYHQEDLVSLVAQTLDTLKPLAIKKDIHLVLDAKVNELTMDLDAPKMRTIIHNLVSNALKHTGNKGLVRVVLRSSESESGEQVEIDVADNGSGIRSKDIPHIFDRFFRSDDPSSSHLSGTGIGLALVKELVDLMNGNITVSSNLGQGSTFSVALPLTRSAPIAIGKPTFVADESLEEDERFEAHYTTHESDALVLVVEDSEDVITYLTQILGGEFKLLVARNGEEGLNVAFDQIPDLVISDVMMPKMDGYRFCDALKRDERTNHIPVILLTAKVEEKDRYEGFTMGADAYITKPFLKDELILRVRKLLELRDLLHKKYSQFALLSPSQSNEKTDKFIFKVNAFLENQLANEELTAEDFASGMFMSRMQLHRKLKALSGKSASQYVRSFRMHRAKPLLADSSLTISEVSWKVGFKDPNYFSKCFINEFGMTPSAFRMNATS